MWDGRGGGSGVGGGVVGLHIPGVSRAPPEHVWYSSALGAFMPNRAYGIPIENPGKSGNKPGFEVWGSGGPFLL